MSSKTDTSIISPITSSKDGVDGLVNKLQTDTGLLSRPVGAQISVTPVQQMISSCTGALITSLFVTPFDVVKIRLQSQAKPLRSGSCFIYHNGLMDCLCMCSYCANGQANSSKATISIQPWYRKPSYFNGTVDAFIKIARNEGLASLWSGLPPTLVMAVPATVFYFTTYDYLKYKMGYREKDSRTQYIPMLAGSSARVGTVILISPLELIRTKMQSRQLSYKQLGEAVRLSVQHGGLMSMMRGLGPSLWRDVPFSSLYWFGYEYFKALQLKFSNSEEVTFTQGFIAGGLSGTIAAVLTLPFDVLKTHRQIELGEAEMLKDRTVSPTLDMMKNIYRRQGIPGFFTGTAPRVLKVAPACAIMIGSYEYFKVYFHRKNLLKKEAERVKDWS